jgi:YHS domain-containing protein
MKVNEAEAPGGKSNYAGETYYFCSDACRKDFGEDPAKYIAQRTQP